MTDLMQAIYNFIEEHCYKEYLPRQYYWHHQRVLELQESTLLDTLSAEQQVLLEQYQETQTLCHIQELEAMFQAAWAAARELA